MAKWSALLTAAADGSQACEVAGDPAATVAAFKALRSAGGKANVVSAVVVTAAGIIHSAKFDPKAKPEAPKRKRD